MKYPRGRLMVFCKAPEAGKVNTRLANAMNAIGLDGHSIAAKIHEYLVLERLSQVTKGALAPVELWCSPNKSHAFFRECERRFSVVLKEQVGKDLGERMLNAFEDVLSEVPYAILIGTDCPGLDTEKINQAFHHLNEKACSVIGPAEDGGYVLIGLCAQQPVIFQNMEWGTSRVCDETLRRIEGEVEILPRSWDLDRLDDLYRLITSARELKLSKEFIAYLDSIELSSLHGNN